MDGEYVCAELSSVVPLPREHKEVCDRTIGEGMDALENLHDPE